MNNRPFKFVPLETPGLVEALGSLPKSGILKTSESRWTYLDLDDDYIHLAFPFLEQLQEPIVKPDYFGIHLAGAHITVIYPEERRFARNEDLEKKHSFAIKGVYTADLGQKRYYVLGVEAESLLTLRTSYGLGEQLCFKGYWVDLHITIGTAPLKK